MNSNTNIELQKAQHRFDLLIFLGKIGIESANSHSTLTLTLIEIQLNELTTTAKRIEQNVRTLTSEISSTNPKKYNRK